MRKYRGCEHGTTTGGDARGSKIEFENQPTPSPISFQSLSLAVRGKFLRAGGICVCAKSQRLAAVCVGFIICVFVLASGCRSADNLQPINWRVVVLFARRQAVE
jgi:hypothetical protein